MMLNPLDLPPFPHSPSSIDPPQVSSMNITREDGNISLSWDAPVTAAHVVSYRVTPTSRGMALTHTSALMSQQHAHVSASVSFVSQPCQVKWGEDHPSGYLCLRN